MQGKERRERREERGEKRGDMEIEKRWGER